MRWTRLLFVAKDVDIRDNYPDAPDSRVYVPDDAGTGFDIVFVELVNRGDPTEHKADETGAHPDVLQGPAGAAAVDRAGADSAKRVGVPALRDPVGAAARRSGDQPGAFATEGDAAVAAAGGRAGMGAGQRSRQNVVWKPRLHSSEFGTQIGKY
jgi:hypothetical protein